MYLKEIKSFINKYTGKNNKKRRKTSTNRLILSKMEQSTFIKKRNTIKFNSINFKKIKFLGNNEFHYYLLIFIIFISLIIYFLFGPTFKIKNIEIIKQDNVTNMIIAYKAIEKYRGKSIFNFEEKEILKRLKDYQFNIKDIETDIVLPNTLKININSYKGLFNTTINNKTYLITENGTLIPQTYSEELQELKIIKEFDKNKFIDYKKVLGTNFIKSISTITEGIKENIIEIKIEEIKYYLIERELHIKTDGNKTIIFNLNSDIKEQIEKITIFNKDQLNINKSNIMYIDLRIKNKVFYCTTETEYQCIQNIKSVYSN